MFRSYLSQHPHHWLQIFLKQQPFTLSCLSPPPNNDHAHYPQIKKQQPWGPLPEPTTPCWACLDINSTQTILSCTGCCQSRGWEQGQVSWQLQYGVKMTTRGIATWVMGAQRRRISASLGFSVYFHFLFANAQGLLGAPLLSQAGWSWATVLVVPLYEPLGVSQTMYLLVVYC